MTGLRVHAMGKHCSERTKIGFSGAEDAAQRPGLPEWTTNVYGECFYRFRHVAGSLGGSYLSTLVSEVRRQPTYSMTALCSLRENTVTKARKLISAPRGDAARPPGLSDWITNVCGECFFRFRDAAEVLCVA